MWKDNHPVYNCKHMIPFTYTHAYINRLKDNNVIVEVWNKLPGCGPGNDALIGLCKLPTNQFHLSLSASEHHATPVIALDGYLPVIDVINNEKCGLLQCYLAIGSHDQLSDLVHKRNLPQQVTQRPIKLPAEKPEIVGGDLEKHVFNIAVNNVNNMDILDDGDISECFVTFTFTRSDKASKTTSAPASPSMAFNYNTSTTITLPETTSLQHHLLQHLDDGCVVFSIMRRYFYPNTREVLCGSGVLTLQELSRVITLTPPSIHQYNIPLTSTLNEDYTVGTLSVTLQYNKDTMTERASTPNFVSLCVNVNRGCGLQYAAETALSHGAQLEHAAVVGVDSYVTVSDYLLI